MNQELFDKGLKVRREVLGAEYVDKSIASADDFNRPMQELVTEYCWGEIWNRPGLDRDPQHHQSVDAHRPEPAARDQAPCAGRDQQRPDQGRDLGKYFCRQPSIAACRRRSTASASRAKSSRNRGSDEQADRIHRDRPDGPAHGRAAGGGGARGAGPRPAGRSAGAAVRGAWRDGCRLRGAARAILRSHHPDAATAPLSTRCCGATDLAASPGAAC